MRTECTGVGDGENAGHGRARYEYESVYRVQRGESNKKSFFYFFYC